MWWEVAPSLMDWSTITMRSSGKIKPHVLPDSAEFIQALVRKANGWGGGGGWRSNRTVLRGRGGWGVEEGRTSWGRGGRLRWNMEGGEPVQHGAWSHQLFCLGAALSISALITSWLAEPADRETQSGWHHSWPVTSQLASDITAGPDHRSYSEHVETTWFCQHSVGFYSQTALAVHASKHSADGTFGFCNFYTYRYFSSPLIIDLLKFCISCCLSVFWCHF